MDSGGTEKVDSWGTRDSNSKGMWEGASEGVREVVVEGEGEVAGGVIEVEWGGAEEVVWGNAREVYLWCDWGKYKLKNLCYILLLLFVYLKLCILLNLFYDVAIEINACTHPPKFRSVRHTWEISWESCYGWCKHER